MRTRRTGGDNGYQAPEDFANEGRGYQPANRTDINSVIHDRVDTVADTEEPVDNNDTAEDRNKSREGYDNGSNVNDDAADDQSFAASTGKMS